MSATDARPSILERPMDAVAADPLVVPTAPREGGLVGVDAGVFAIMSTTRAMRRLAPDPVPDDLLQSVVEAATWAPSPGNSQLARYLLVTDRATIARLAVPWRRVVEDFRAAADAAGLSEASFARDGSAIDYQCDHFSEIPALIVVCLDVAAAGPVRGRWATLATLMRRTGIRRGVRIARAARQLDRSLPGAVYPAVQNLLLAARAHGLGACLTTWHLLAEDEFKEVLGIPDHVTTWAVIPIGWPLGRFGSVRRRPVDEVIHRDRW